MVSKKVDWTVNWMRRYYRPPTYDVIIQEIMLPMRDGVHLATDLYFPANDGKRVPRKHPVLLTRFGLGEKSRDAPNARYFASRGYVVAVQNQRGRYKSEGTGQFRLYIHQQYDGADTVEWLAKQPWSNGKVGTYGVSHSGVNQYSLATERPDGLTAMVPAFAQSNYAKWSMRTGGAYELRSFHARFNTARTGHTATMDPVAGKALRQAYELFPEWLTKRAMLGFFLRGLNPLRFADWEEDWLINVWHKSDFPGPDDWWMDPGFNLEPYYDTMADVPMLHHTGWYDTYTYSMGDNYAIFSNKKKSLQWLMIGPWTHTTAIPSFAGDVDFGSEADGDYNAIRLRWFDQWLMGIDTGITKEPPVKIFIMGGGDGRRNSAGRMNHGGYWREEHEWPLARTQYTPYYFHHDGMLSTTPPAENAPLITYTFDPRNPVPTIGGNISAFGRYLIAGAFDQTCRDDLIGCDDNLPLSSRPDVVVFQTPPLTEDIEVTGPLKVKLYFSSTAVDTDFTAKLIDVHPPNIDYPNGYEMNLADGIVRARYRNTREHPEFLEPGELYECTIEPYPTANLFKAGHRIRVDISSSNFPRFDVNPNSGEPIGKSRRFMIADNTIYVDSKRPSHITLPIIPIKTKQKR